VLAPVYYILGGTKSGEVCIKGLMGKNISFGCIISSTVAA